MRKLTVIKFSDFCKDQKIKIPAFIDKVSEGTERLRFLTLFNLVNCKGVVKMFLNFNYAM